MILRPYQQRAVDDTLANLGDNPILVAPTGSGKTVTASALVHQLDRPTLWLAHRRELISQAAITLEGYDLRCGIIMAGFAPSPARQVQVASVQTLARRENPPVELIVVDECHHARATSYRKLLDAYPGVPVVGLTATPFRLDGKGLGDVGFRRIIVACYPDELCQDGTLIEPVVYAPDAPDLAGARIQHGDYADGDMFRAMTKSTITGNVVRTWFQRAGGKRTVVFAVNVEHSWQIVAEFRKHSILAEHLDGKTPRTMRDAILFRLKTGYTRVVSNCQVLTEGWDLPKLEVAIVARPTASLCLHLQQLGRIMRSAPEKTGALVLDHAGNHLRHGFVTQRLEYSLDDTPTQTRASTAEGAAGKRCPGCYLMVPPGTSECPECGHEFKPEAPKHVDGELTRLTPAAQRPRPSIENQQAAWARIEFQRQHFGYQAGWSFHRFKATFGFYPLVVGSVVVDPATASRDQRLSVFLRLDARRKEKGYKPGWTGYQYKEIFGHWPPFSAKRAS